MTRALLLTLAATLTLPGCAYLMGYDQLPQPRLAFKPRPEASEWRGKGLVVEAKAPAPGERIATERNMVGRVARAVNPYGEDVLVVRLSLANTGEGLVQLAPSRATLVADGGEPRHALALDDFRKRWPTWATADPDQAADREAAIAFVLNTLVLDRVLPPGAKAEGRIAFLLPPHVRRQLAFTLPAKVEDEDAPITFTWEAL